MRIRAELETGRQLRGRNRVAVFDAEVEFEVVREVVERALERVVAAGPPSGGIATRKR